MLGIRIEGEYHWGYWVRIPGTSKQQSALPLPPPTSLIGALAFPLARRGLLAESVGQGKIVGETIFPVFNGKCAPLSTASSFADAFLGASMFLNGKAIMWEDINKYTTVHFQTTTKDKPEEKAAGGRRYLEKYRTGAISSGKVLYPKGKATVFFIFDEETLSKYILPPWDRNLEETLWSISRIGSKESIFSVNKAELVEVKKKSEDVVKTKLYFPAEAGEVRTGEEFRSYKLAFWKGGWGRVDPPVFSEYVIPGSRSPISSEAISVRVKGSSYEFASDEVMILER